MTDTLAELSDERDRKIQNAESLTAYQRRHEEHRRIARAMEAASDAAPSAEQIAEQAIEQLDVQLAALARARLDDPASPTVERVFRELEEKWSRRRDSKSHGAALDALCQTWASDGIPAELADAFPWLAESLADLDDDPDTATRYREIALRDLLRDAWRDKFPSWLLAAYPELDVPPPPRWTSPKPTLAEELEHVREHEAERVLADVLRAALDGHPRYSPLVEPRPGGVSLSLPEWCARCWSRDRRVEALAFALAPHLHPARRPPPAPRSEL